MLISTESMQQTPSKSAVASEALQLSNSQETEKVQKGKYRDKENKGGRFNLQVQN